jgi:hypothetical protein
MSADSQHQSREAEAAHRAFRRTVMLVDREYQLREVGWIIGIFIVLIVSQLFLFGLLAYLRHHDVLGGLLAAVLFTAVALTVPTVLGVFASWVTFRRTHRVAGAAYRLTQDMEKALRRPGFRFKLRKNDYLQDLADELNRALDTYEAREGAMEAAESCLRDVRACAKSVLSHLPATEAGRLQAALEELQAALEEVRSRQAAASGASGSAEASAPGGAASAPAAG